MDEDGFIKATDFTAGNVHDTHCFGELLRGGVNLLRKIQLMQEDYD